MEQLRHIGKSPTFFEQTVNQIGKRIDDISAVPVIIASRRNCIQQLVLLLPPSYPPFLDDREIDMHLTEIISMSNNQIILCSGGGSFLWRRMRSRRRQKHLEFVKEHKMLDVELHRLDYAESFVELSVTFAASCLQLDELLVYLYEPLQ